MFFLGGLNSVLPYIIYLSLIWVFLIIGLSGKILQARQLLLPGSHYSESSFPYHDGSKVFNYNPAHPSSLKTKAQNAQPFYFAEHFFPAFLAIIPGISDCVPYYSSGYYSSYGLRSPPPACNSI
jgi:hypothetical protein